MRRNEPLSACGGRLWSGACGVGMELFTVTGKTYRDALQSAVRKYGKRLRVQSKRTVKTSGVFGLGRGEVCELVCYLADEDPNESGAETDGAEEKAESSVSEERSDAAPGGVPEGVEPEGRGTEGGEVPGVGGRGMSSPEGASAQAAPRSQDGSGESIVEYYAAVVEKILRMNDFSDSYIRWCLDSLAPGFVDAMGQPRDIGAGELESMVFNQIASSVKISHNYQIRPQRVCVLLGPSGSGKTSLLSKLAWVYAMQATPDGKPVRSVRVVCTDRNTETVMHYQRLSEAMPLIGFETAGDESELSTALYRHPGADLFFVDTLGSPISSTGTDYKLYSLLNIMDQANTSFILTIPATMKNSDIEQMLSMYKAFPVNIIAVTRFDETLTVGNVVSAIRQLDKPFVYVSGGRVIPRDFQMATLKGILSRLRGFTIDISSILGNS